MNFILVVALLASVLPQSDLDKARNRVTVSYDRFKDATTYRSEEIGVKCVWCPGNVSLWLTASHPKMTPTRVDEVNLLMARSGKEWAFLRPHERGLIILADAKRHDFGVMKVLDTQVRRYGVSEYLYVTMSAEEFAELAGAEKLEIQVGAYEFNVQDKHVLKVRAFAEEISAAGKPTPPDPAPDPRTIPVAPKPTPTPQKRICSQNGYRVPCPEEKP
jgi:hypothetical protein